MKTIFVSLGPTCLAAEILKAGDMRSCTYGFDWVRSGSFFVKEFLNIPTSLFIEKYVKQPCIPLKQNEDPT